MGQKKSYIVNNIERLEETEKRCGIRIESANAIYDGPYLDGNMHAIVHAEIHAVSGTTIDDDCHIIGTAFDEEGKVMASAKEDVKADNFFTLAPLALHLSVMAKPAKIKIYAQKGLS